MLMLPTGIGLASEDISARCAYLTPSKRVMIKCFYMESGNFYYLQQIMWYHMVPLGKNKKAGSNKSTKKSLEKNLGDNIYIKCRRRIYNTQMKQHNIQLYMHCHCPLRSFFIECLPSALGKHRMVNIMGKWLTLFHKWRVNLMASDQA